ncbi:hypothetical protein [Myroides sp.]|uniref:hypothetical protein n=1 Tax=Myroides sp. TaxID=1874736 RepID=UPI0028AB6B80|nr:hypothetical protein [Myroides sp.]
MKHKNLLFHHLFIAVIGIDNALAQLQVQKLEFDLDKDGITDTVWFDIDKGRLEVLLSIQANQSIHTPFFFDPLKIYSYQLIPGKQNFRLYVMKLLLITDALFYWSQIIVKTMYFSAFSFQLLKMFTFDIWNINEPADIVYHV